jgi:hypothetical protein
MFIFLLIFYSTKVHNASRMRRDQNDHAMKRNNQTPEPEGSGRKHCETKQPMRLLSASILKKALQNEVTSSFFKLHV